MWVDLILSPPPVNEIRNALGTAFEIFNNHYYVLHQQGRNQKTFEENSRGEDISKMAEKTDG